MKKLVAELMISKIRRSRRNQGKKQFARKLEKMMALAQSQSLAVFDTVADDFQEIDKNCGELFPEVMQLGRWWKVRKNGALTYVSRMPDVFDIIVSVGTDLETTLLTVRSLQTPSA
jgi:hypothetical protein